MPSATRSYRDPCGIARALDLVGERWALLVVRELLLGPKRFSQLRRGLHYASPNVLSQRLRELEQAGIVRRQMLAPPASVLVYELTERGRDLEPVLVELGRWGGRAPITTSTQLSLDALLVALKTTFDATRAATLQASYELQIGGDLIRVDIPDGLLEIGRGAAEQPVAVLHTDVDTLRAVVFGRQSVADAIDTGALVVDGRRRAVERFAALFSLTT